MFDERTSYIETNKYFHHWIFSSFLFIHFPFSGLEAGWWHYCLVYVFILVVDGSAAAWLPFTLMTMFYFNANNFSSHSLIFRYTRHFNWVEIYLSVQLSPLFCVISWCNLLFLYVRNLERKQTWIEWRWWLWNRLKKNRMPSSLIFTLFSVIVNTQPSTYVHKSFKTDQSSSFCRIFTFTDFRLFSFFFLHHNYDFRSMVFL